MTRLCFLACASLLTMLWASVASAQLTSSDRQRLLDRIESAQGELDPAQLPDFDSASREVLERVEGLSQFLQRVTDSANREAWLRYFDLQPLTSAIESEASASDLMEEAMSARDRMIGTVPGLEMSAVRKLRDSVEDLINAIRFRNQDESIQLLESQLQALKEMVSQADDSPSPDQYAAIAARVGLFESSGQAAGLVREFRDTFDRPNMAIMVGSTLVHQAIGRPVVRDRPVRDCILGTRLVGNALMQGQVTASLLPSDNQALIQLVFVGDVTTNNTGYNGPVRLKTVGNGHVTVTQTMSVDASGMLFGNPATEASLSTRILCIDHKLALVRAIARKQAAKQKPTADRIALGKLRSQVASQFAEETTQVDPVTPSELLRRAEPMLQRLSLTQPTQHWSSTEEAISIDSLWRGPDQLAAVVSRPAVSSPFAFAVQIHESAVENAFSVMLAGRSLDERRLNEILEKVGPMKKAAEAEEDSEPPFEISFSRSRPVIFEARNDSLRLGLRGTRFVQGDRAPLVKAMEITAIYKPVISEEGSMRLQRSGEVEVEFPRSRLTLREAGLKPIIQKEFSQVFPEQILDESIRVGEDAKLQSMRGREFLPSLVGAQDGWLTVAFR